MMITQTRVQVSVQLQVTSTLAIQNTMSKYSSSHKVKISSEQTKSELTGIIDLLDLSRSFRQTREMVNSRLYNNNPYLSSLFCKKSPCQSYYIIYIPNGIQGSN